MKHVAAKSLTLTLTLTLIGGGLKPKVLGQSSDGDPLVAAKFVETAMLATRGTMASFDLKAVCVGSCAASSWFQDAIRSGPT